MTEVERPVELVPAADAEADAAVDAPAVVADAAAAAEAPAAEKKPLRPEDVIIPPKPEKVPNPDEEAFKKEVAELEAQIEKSRKAVEDIRNSFSRKDGSRDAAGRERAELRAKLQEAQKISRAKFDEVVAAREELKVAQKARDVAIAEEGKLKLTLKIPDLKILEKRLAELDAKIATETQDSLAEEKKLIAEREQLRASKPLILAFQAKRDDVQAKKKIIDTIFERVRAVSAEVNTLRDGEKKIRDEFEALKTKQAESAKQEPSMAEELKQAKDKRDLLITRIKELRDDFGKKSRAFRQYERALREYTSAKRKREYLEREQERKQRDEAYRAEEQSFDPLAAKRELCNTLIAALQRMQSEQGAAAVAAAPVSLEAMAAKLQTAGKKPGVVYQATKKFSDERVSFVKAKPKVEKAAEKPKQGESLRLSLKMLAQFSELHLSAPSMDLDIPASIEALKSKAAFFESESAKAAAKSAAAKTAAADAPAAPAPAHIDDGPTPPASVEPSTIDA
jgi:hypothetical protein